MIKSTFILSLFVLVSCGQSIKTDNSKKIVNSKEISQTVNIKSKEGKKENQTIENHIKSDFIDYHFNSSQVQSDSLEAFMNKALISDSIHRRIWEQKFFNAFPNSFEGMQNVFGFDNKKGAEPAAPLYSTEGSSIYFMDKLIFSNVIGFFSELNSVPSSTYYEKYININIGGKWAADNIREAFGIHYRILNNTKDVCSVLSLYSDAEIESVFCFIFDGAHPKNEYNERLYIKLKNKIGKENKRLNQLLMSAYEKLVTKDHSHSH